MSLKQIIRKRIFEEVIAKSRSKKEFLVLILDDHTVKIINSCCRMSELTQSGVGVVQIISKKRQKMKMSAVYFLEPCKKSVDGLIEDFNNTKKPQYTGDIHLYFTTDAQKKIHQYSNRTYEDEIVACNNLFSRLKSYSFLNLDFIAHESRVFQFGGINTLPIFHSPIHFGKKKETIDRIACQLASLFITFGEYPYIRYFQSDKNDVAHLIAKRVREYLKSVVADPECCSKLNWEKPQERAVLIILDRTVDPLSPLMHEYTYQAMITDLLPLEGEICRLPITGKSDLGDEVVLNEEDELWNDYRHSHIAEVMDGLLSKFKEMRDSNAAVKMYEGETESLNVSDLRKAMNDMPHCRETIRNLLKHLSVCECLMKKCKTDNLNEIAELEQDMATGYNNKGEKVTTNIIQKSIIEMIRRDDISTNLKLRLVMIYIISQGGITPDFREKIFTESKLNFKEKALILNLRHLGVTLQKSAKKSQHKPSHLSRQSKRAQELDLILMRYLPLFEEILSVCLANRLDDEEFPYEGEEPQDPILYNTINNSIPKNTSGILQGRFGHHTNNDRNSTSSRPIRKRNPLLDVQDTPNITSSQNIDINETRGRKLIFFLPGGITQNEIRTIYSISRDSAVDIYIGTDSLSTPTSFIKTLEQMENKTS